MTHRFPLKEIARQAGLGTATVDRVLHDRPNVSPQTRARVMAAIAELEGQETQLAARGRRMFFDFVIEAPARFSREVRAATDEVARNISTAVCRPRFLMQDVMTEKEVVANLERIAKRGSHGVCLKARDLPSIRDAVDRLVAAGIPVVTLVTDISAGRIAYVGLDNKSAGRTAAYLIAVALRGRPGNVLATRSDARFLGEEARQTAFVAGLAADAPALSVIDVSGGRGVHFDTAQLIDAALADIDDVVAVYSMGGGNRSILDTLRQHGQVPEVFVAHDLDQENRRLIADGAINFVLYHDLRHDMRNVFLAFLWHHRLILNFPDTLSNIQVLTPANIPAPDLKPSVRGA